MTLARSRWAGKSSRRTRIPTWPSFPSHGMIACPISSDCSCCAAQRRRRQTSGYVNLCVGSSGRSSASLLRSTSKGYSRTVHPRCLSCSCSVLAPTQYSICSNLLKRRASETASELFLWGRGKGHWQSDTWRKPGDQETGSACRTATSQSHGCPDWKLSLSRRWEQERDLLTSTRTSGCG